VIALATAFGLLLAAWLWRIRSQLRSLTRTATKNQESTMGQLEDIRDEFDKATTAVAVEIDAIKSELAAALAAGQAPSAATVASLQSIADRLKAMGPAAPVPAAAATTPTL
jgi:adenylosuccinate lyase